jgi:DNA-directed RNA polymerase subunit F
MAWPGLCLSLGFLLVAGSGCETSDHVGKAETVAGKSVAGPTDNHGYALLADLSGDEKDVSKLRFLKRERPELKALLQEIASTNRVAYEALQKFAKADPALNLKDKGLPAAEVATREAISKSKEKAILSSKGKDLEVQLLLDQSEALTYGSHLASVIALAEPNPQRREFLQRLSVNFGVLQQRVLRMLSSGYTPP